MKRVLIFGGVCFYFLLGTLAGVRVDSYFTKMPVLGATVRLIGKLKFVQTWAMFSPPPSRNDDLAYEVLTGPGKASSGLRFPGKPMAEAIEARWILQPRSARRLIDIYKVRASPNEKMNDQMTYDYVAMSDYFCGGGEGFEDVRVVRFYVTSKPFDRKFFPEEAAATKDGVEFSEPVRTLIFERNCGQI